MGNVKWVHQLTDTHSMQVSNATGRAGGRSRNGSKQHLPTDFLQSNISEKSIQRVIKEL